MALMRTMMRPGRSPWETSTGLYESTLARWLNRQQQMGEQFGRAETPLQELKSYYAPGGGYGAGQQEIIEEEGRKTLAQGLHNLVATGMSSGSLATGLRAQVGRGITRGKIAIEESRAKQFAETLTGLSRLRAGFGQLLGTAQEPSYAPVVGAVTGIYGTDIGYRAGQERMGLSETLARLSAHNQPTTTSYRTIPSSSRLAFNI